MNRLESSATMGENLWINPIGGLGDVLMISGVLKLFADRIPSMKFNLIRRTKYLALLKGHPALDCIGFPPKEAETKRVDYWNMEKVGPGDQRPFQVLARSFGLPTPVEETLYLPGEPESDPLLHEMIPWKKKNVIIAPASDSPRKMMHPGIWYRLTELFAREGALVMQVGRMQNLQIRNAYSLLGLTTPRQLVALVKRCDLVVTPDNFVMHAAHLTGTPAVVCWGATHHEVYGYPEQAHLQAPKSCDFNPHGSCFRPHEDKNRSEYATPCPMREKHCLDQLRPESVYETARSLLAR